MTERDRLDPVAMATITALCALWAFQQVTIKVANTGISPAFQCGLRSLGAIVLLLGWSRLRGIPLFQRDGTLVAGLIAGAMFAAEFALIYWSLVFTEVARSTVFLYTAPFFVALGAHLFVPGECIRRMQLVGLICAFAGVVLAVSDGLSLPTTRALIGDAMMPVAAMLWAGTTIVIKATKLARIAPEKTLAYQLAVSGVALTVLAPLFGELGFFSPTPIVLVRIYPATRLSAFTFLTPVFSVSFGALLLGERVSALLIAALALVAFGIWLVNRPEPA